MGVLATTLSYNQELILRAEIERANAQRELDVAQERFNIRIRTIEAAPERIAACQIGLRETRKKLVLLDFAARIERLRQLRAEVGQQ